MKRFLLIGFGALALAVQALAGSISTTFDPTTGDSSLNGFSIGDVWRNTRTENNFVAVNVTPGSVVWRMAERLLCSGATLTSNAADTNELALGTCTVPANAMGSNGILRISGAFSYTNSGNNKSIRVRIGGIGGTIIQGITTTTSTNISTFTILQNRTTATQVGWMSGTTSQMFAGLAASTVTTSVDTTADTTIVFTGQKASAGETLSLEQFMVELIRPDIR